MADLAALSTLAKQTGCPIEISSLTSPRSSQPSPPPSFHLHSPSAATSPAANGRGPKNASPPTPNSRKNSGTRSPILLAVSKITQPQEDVPADNNLSRRHSMPLAAKPLYGSPEENLAALDDLGNAEARASVGPEATEYGGQDRRQHSASDEVKGAAHHLNENEEASPARRMEQVRSSARALLLTSSSAARVRGEKSRPGEHGRDSIGDFPSQAQWVHIQCSCVYDQLACQSRNGTYVAATDVLVGLLALVACLNLPPGASRRQNRNFQTPFKILCCKRKVHCREPLGCSYSTECHRRLRWRGADAKRRAGILQSQSRMFRIHQARQPVGASAALLAPMNRSLRGRTFFIMHRYAIFNQPEPPWTVRCK